MENRNLDKALDIVSKLITGENVSERGENAALYQEYNNNAEVYDIVHMSLKKLNLNIYEYNNGLYVSAGDNNRVFGYSNEELRNVLGLRVNKELYLAYFIIYNIITIYQKYRELQREKENYFVEQQQIKAMKLRLEEAENFYGSIRKVRHEMKNHMTNIKGLAARDQYEEIDRYIEKLDATIEELDYKYATGNAVTDVLINDKYKKAIREEILFDVKFDYRDSDTISVFDMGMILNNLLDNAIEACRKIEKEKRYIRLSLKRKDNFLLITVENSFDGILQQAEDGLPRTMKETELPEILMEHGVGLRNVRELAERYFGAVNIEAKGNRFKVTVMLQKQQ